VGGGAAPGVNGGFTIEGGLRYRAFSASLEARADVPGSASASSGATARAGIFAAGLVPCFHVRYLAACGVSLIGALRGSGSGVPVPKVDVTPYAALGVRLGAEIPIAGAIAAVVHGNFAATLTRTALQLDGSAVWTTPPVLAWLGVGLRAHFR
jgi:hypothetical protein